MARVKFGGGVDSMSGSYGGQTFSRNRYGAYVRSRTTPVNPNSSRQQIARGIFQFVAEKWTSGLTEVQRAAWNLYGSSVAMTGKFGDTIYLSGFSHFLRSNCSRLKAGIVDVQAGPTSFLLPEADATFTPTVSEATQLISIVFDTNLAWVDEDEAFMSVQMSAPHNIGRDFIGGPYRYAGVIEGDSVTPPTSPQTVAVPFAVVQNQQVIVRARIGRADARLSEFFQLHATVGA